MLGKVKSLAVQLFVTSCIVISNCEVPPPGYNENAGLYNGFKEVTLFNAYNLEDILYKQQNGKLWLVEFYKDWCGDCQRFVVQIKALAIDTYEWRDTVRIGVIDCANPYNTVICRKFNVARVPDLTIFHPHSSNPEDGVKFAHEGHTTYPKVREEIVKILKEYQESQSSIDGPVNLKPFKSCNLSELFKTFPEEVNFLVFVFEGADSPIGSELALDISRTKQVRVRLVDPNNNYVYQQFGFTPEEKGAVVIQRNSVPQSVQCSTDVPFFAVPLPKFTRETLNVGVRKFLIRNNVEIPPNLPVVPPFLTHINDTDIQKARHWRGNLSKALNVSDLNTVVFLMDLEAAVATAFNREITLTQFITGEKLEALKNFIKVLAKYFPTGKQGKRLFKDLEVTVLNQDPVRGDHLKDIFNQLEKKYHPFLPNSEWVNCRGTIPHFRGYPCSLWMTFHTLVAREDLLERNVPGKKPESLNAMVGYIKNFFSCSNCAENFIKMAVTIPGNVTTTKDAVLWLWSAHNSANHRLAGDITEDPLHHKVQFPDKTDCPLCHNSDGTWNEYVVFDLISTMYTNIVNFDPHQLPQ